MTAHGSGECGGGGTIVKLDGRLPLLVKYALKMWLLLSRTFKCSCGAYVFCTREAFIETGGFDERYYASEEIHFSRALHRWGKKEGKSFIILEEPIISSSRKMVWYSVWEILIMTLGLMLHFKPLQNRDACYKMWYRQIEKQG